MARQTGLRDRSHQSYGGVNPLFASHQLYVDALCGMLAVSPSAEDIFHACEERHLGEWTVSFGYRTWAWSREALQECSLDELTALYAALKSNSLQGELH